MLGGMMGGLDPPLMVMDLDETYALTQRSGERADTFVFNADADYGHDGRYLVGTLDAHTSSDFFLV